MSSNPVHSLAALVLVASSASAWQVAELRSISVPPSDLVFDFGNALALSGDRLAVGAPSDNSEDNYPGAVYVLERQASGAWLRTAFLQPPDGGGADGFGARVALSGDRLLASMPWPGSDCEDCTYPPPRVYLFEPDAAGAWREVTRFDTTPQVSAGGGIAIDGDWVLVGGRRPDGTGAVRSFERDGSGAWIERGTLAPIVPNPTQEFGSPVVLRGGRALVGAPNDAEHGQDAGAAFVFERNPDGTWRQDVKLVASDATTFDLFGSGLDLRGERVAVGAHGIRSTELGAAYLFEKQGGGNWLEVAKLVASDPRQNHGFGWSVALGDQRCVVSALSDDDQGINAGAAYVFERQANGAWPEVAKLKASDGATRGRFGAAQAQDGDRGLFGAPGLGTGSLYDGGSVYEFDFRPLDADAAQLSLASGGVQRFGLDAGHLHASETYLLLGSLAGTSPGISLGGGRRLPLNADAYLGWTLRNPNVPPLQRSLGVLDARGHAVASFRLPAGAPASLIGATFHHAFVTVGASGITFVSNPVPLAIVP
jgi:hypothetical protein